VHDLAVAILSEWYSAVSFIPGQLNRTVLSPMPVRSTPTAFCAVVKSRQRADRYETAVPPNRSLGPFACQPPCVLGAVGPASLKSLGRDYAFSGQRVVPCAAICTRQAGGV